MMDALSLLQELIRRPSFSKEEGATADFLVHALKLHGLPAQRVGHNVWSWVPSTVEGAPWAMMNSHHDTVRPNSGFTRDPFTPIIEADKLYGLGSNDAGGALCAMFEAFVQYATNPNRRINLVWSAVAEEEITGPGGIAELWSDPIFQEVTNGQFAEGGSGFVLIGEPTEMNPAVAEKGLMVLDALATGRAGHAARTEGDSALERALRDITWLHSQPMTKDSTWLGQSKVTVTSIHTPNVQHNVVPDECRFVVDVRLNEHYQPAEALEFLQRGTESTLTPRSLRFRPKSTPEFHPVVARALELGGAPYGSPTCSDWSQVQVAALKIGPGSSSRSHTSDEFIYIHEVRDAVPQYLQLLDALTPP